MTSAIVSDPFQASAREKPTVLSVLRKDLPTPSGFKLLVLQPASKGLAWAEKLHGLSDRLLKVKKSLTVSNRLIVWFSFPKNVKKFGKSAFKLMDSVKRGSVEDITKNSKNTILLGTQVGALISSSLELAHSEGLIALSARALTVVNTVGFLGFTGLLFSSLIGVQKQFAITERVEFLSPEFKLAFSRLIAKTMLVVLTIFSMVTIAVGAGAFASWLMLGLSTAYLLLSIHNHFYDELVVKSS